MKIIGVIPARYKSSRFPGKPLASICGKPMIWWVYQQAKKVTDFTDLCVATDDKKIMSVCESFGLNVVMTQSKHPTGSDRVAEVATKIDGELYVNIQGDEPLIAPEMIQQVIRIFDDASVYFGTLKNKIDSIEEIQSSSTVKVVTDKNDDALYFSRSVIPSNIKEMRNSQVFRHVGIYAYRHDFLQWFGHTPQSSLELSENIEPLRAMEHGYKIRVIETPYRSIGVDLPEHIPMVEKRILEEIR